MAELARETGLRRGRVVVMILMITHFLMNYYIRFFSNKTLNVVRFFAFFLDRTTKFVQQYSRTFVLFW